jgi:hypothetical protein
MEAESEKIKLVEKLADLIPVLLSNIINRTLNQEVKNCENNS